MAYLPRKYWYILPNTSPSIFMGVSENALNRIAKVGGSPKITPNLPPNVWALPVTEGYNEGRVTPRCPMIREAALHVGTE